MHILHINSEEGADKIDEMIKQGNDVFILVYMKGCGPCNATRPEWESIEFALKDQYATNNKLVVIDVNKDFLSRIKHIGDVDWFPTIKYIGDYGKTIETYENSSVKKKDKSVNSFINWIESKINNVVSAVPDSSTNNLYNRILMSQKNKKGHNKTHRNKTHRNKTHRNKTHHNKTHRNKNIKYNRKNKSLKGGKWTKKYKLSINCNKPKGFSQKQYCKYGRK